MQDLRSMRQKWLRNEYNATNQKSMSTKKKICHLLMDLSVTVRVRTENENNDFLLLTGFFNVFNDSSLCD